MRKNPGGGDGCVLRRRRCPASGAGRQRGFQAAENKANKVAKKLLTKFSSKFKNDNEFREQFGKLKAASRFRGIEPPATSTRSRVQAARCREKATGRGEPNNSGFSESRRTGTFRLAGTAQPKFRPPVDERKRAEAEQGRLRRRLVENATVSRDSLNPGSVADFFCWRQFSTPSRVAPAAGNGYGRRPDEATKRAAGGKKNSDRSGFAELQEQPGRFPVLDVWELRAASPVRGRQQPEERAGG